MSSTYILSPLRFDGVIRIEGIFATAPLLVQSLCVWEHGCWQGLSWAGIRGAAGGVHGSQGPGRGERGAGRGEGLGPWAGGDHGKG